MANFDTVGQQCLTGVIRDSDPAALLSEHVVQQIARGVWGASFRPQPPLLGGESDNKLLLHPDRACEGCGTQRCPQPSLASAAVILDVTGWIQKSHVPLRCRKRKGCDWSGRLQWHNYVVAHGKHLFRGRPDELQCLMLSASFGFTIAYLRQLHARMLREHVSFAGEAWVATAVHAGCPGETAAPGGHLRLYLSEGWHKWRLALRLQAMGAVACLRELNLSEPAEVCIAARWSDLLSHFNKSVAEAAAASGARCDVLIVDGNAKNRRSVCAASFQHRVWDDNLNRGVRVACPCTPMLGSIFCRTHQSWEVEDCVQQQDPNLEIVAHRVDGGNVEVVESSRQFLFQVRAADQDSDASEWKREDELAPSLVSQYFATLGKRRLTEATESKGKKARRDAAWRNHIKQAMSDITPLWDALSPRERQQTLALHAAAADLDAVACSTHKEGEREKLLHGRTAGVLVACMSNGLVVGFRECYGVESLSQRYLFVSELRSRFPALDLIVHDDACHLHKYAEGRAADSVHAASLSPPKMLYACDGFHATGHTDQWCLATCHPKAPHLAAKLTGIRTSVCEFTFTWLSQYKHQAKHMSEHTFKHFIMEMIEAHNRQVLTGATSHLPRARRSRGL